MPPLPLPDNAFPCSSPARAAYDQCLTLEQRGAWNKFDIDLQMQASEHIMFDMSPLVAARVLGYALIFAPTEDGRDSLACEINGCYSDSELLAGLAHLYVFGVLGSFYNPKGPTPAVSANHSSTQSFEEEEEDLGHLLLQPLITPVQLQKLLSFRDNHRCVFTGAFDMHAERPCPRIPGTKFDRMNVAHIISQPLTMNIRDTTEKVREKFEWAMTAGAMIERFGGFSTRDVLHDGVLSSPSNAFLSSSAPHYEFDWLDMWLTPAKDEHHQVIPNAYDVEYYWGKEGLPRLGTGVRPRITFRSAQVGDQTIPPPDPRIISLHAACAQIAHMSGAGEWLQEFFRDSDEISVMTEPNAASELSRALKQVRIQLPSST